MNNICQPEPFYPKCHAQPRRYFTAGSFARTQTPTFYAQVGAEDVAKVKLNNRKLIELNGASKYIPEARVEINIFLFNFWSFCETRLGRGGADFREIPS